MGLLERACAFALAKLYQAMDSIVANRSSSAWTSDMRPEITNRVGNGVRSSTLSRCHLTLNAALLGVTRGAVRHGTALFSL